MTAPRSARPPVPLDLDTDDPVDWPALVRAIWNDDPDDDAPLAPVIPLS